MTIAEAEKAFIEDLTPLYDANEGKSLAWWSISHVCKISKAAFLSDKNQLLSLQDENLLIQILDELKTGKPVQYILGETEFYGLPFKVNPSVLVPRPETEELVDWVLIEVRSKELADGRNELGVGSLGIIKILDIGTGSGCIPVAIKKYLPETEVSAIDISEEALKTAMINADLNHTVIKFLKDDILNPAQVSILNTQYSLIISNPPYVTNLEKAAMHRNVLDHEPHSALFVPDNDPLLFYDRIADFAIEHLILKGLLFLEINENLGAKTVELLAQKGFKNIELRQDMRGRDRMIKAGL